MRLFLALLAVTLARCALAQVSSTSAAAAPSPDTPLARDRFITSLAQELTAHFKFEGELQLELLRPWTPPARTARNWHVAIREFPTVPSSSMLVRCRVQADGEDLADLTVLVRASLWRDAWVTLQPVTAGAPFDAMQLEARRVDLFRDRDVVPTSVGDRTFVFSRTLSAGRLLTWRDLARRPLVKKGQIVEVSAAEGALSVSMKALAMESGARGDTVTVRNAESLKNFAAVVIDENRVQVRF